MNAPNWASVPFGEELASVNAIRAWGHSRGRLLDAAAIPPGAILVINREGATTPPSQPFSKGHTGIVVEDLGDRVHTIEGNCDDAVRAVVHGKNDQGVVGFVRWWS